MTEYGGAGLRGIPACVSAGRGPPCRRSTCRAVAVEHAGLDLAVLAGDVVDVGGQAVQVQGLAVLGGLHQLLGAAPVLVVGVLGQQLLLQGLDAVGVALGVQVGALLHGGEGAQLLG